MSEYKFNPKKYSTHDVLAKLLREHSITESLVLDVGCNDGYIAQAVRLGVWTGIDNNQESVKKAKESGVYQEVYLDNLNASSFDYLKDDDYDVILCADVLEHLKDPQRILTILHRLLKKDGLFIVSLPNVANITARLNLLFGKKHTKTGILDETHLHFYNTYSAKKLLENNKFRVTNVYYGSSVFGILFKVLPLGNLLGHGIILVGRKC